MPAKKPKISESEQVELYMQALEHPLKAEIEAVRSIIKGSSVKINERIKWNAPSYYCGEDFVTFNPRNQKLVHLVFHHPQIVNIRSALLEGDYPDRRMVYFKNMEDVEAKKSEFQLIIKELTDFLLNSTSRQ